MASLALVRENPLSNIHFICVYRCIFCVFVCVMYVQCICNLCVYLNPLKNYLTFFPILELVNLIRFKKLEG